MCKSASMDLCFLIVYYSKKTPHFNIRPLSGIRGGCCNPSYWEDRIGGWPLCRRSAKGSKWLAEGPHYTSGLVLVGGADPDPPGADPIRICWGPRSCRTSSPKTGSPLWVRFPAAAVLGLTTGVGKQDFVCIPGIVSLVGGITIYASPRTWG